ncbi:ribosome biosynthesis protein KRE33 [Ascoidea rubescens DSM 1968]|uniref:RNA cytidine acetyltransferase n=1 Tax=Ascoidea rubescens DSM 1968 TaxID=1344418 RepID=A0A1D2VCW3_9ASCO|nr:DUF699-domain-containing protein [Ascoidea rubescens DSM 1968]ODV59343.1 DUF699-domain-containing protein [Ascoidea rubescens DSM 1968]
MGKKAIDSRIPTLIRNGVQEKKRSFFIIVGDKSRNQLPNLHYLMMSADLKMNKSVLWAYKKKLLGFTSHRKKREAKIKKEIKRGIREANNQDPFEAFISNQHIRYVYYKETDKILGNTYGMCILQDFEALTPNLLARTVETVEGGGLVIILLKSLTSLKQLYTMTMDVHSRYRTEAHNDVVARFNERFILSLGSCDSCLVLDDQLNVLPISGGKTVKPLPPKDEEQLTERELELQDLKKSLQDIQPASSLINLTKTVNQAQAVLTFIDAISEKSLKSTVALTAGRGRGKSAALGIAIAGAISHGYSNIFVTSPSPENLKTLFEFVFKGFDALGFTEHLDYDIIQSINPSFNKAIVRVDIKREHRQTIQYISPTDSHVLGQAELVIIDEAAAIPLPLVKNLLGPYLIFMSSTINGYEGTGRSLSLKLIEQLRNQSNNLNLPKETALITRDKKNSNLLNSGEMVNNYNGRKLKEIVLDEPIRYAIGDPVEKWLNKLLCLDATLSKNSKFSTKGCPHPSECQLYYINRDTLFSYHPVSEAFLQKMMGLYVASHYKNSPNDLQLMSDAPAHQLFVLLPPINENDNRIPDPLCVVQIALEGEISKESVRNSLNRGQRAGGDLIPWLVSQQFQDEEFASLSGARVVRIATNPDYMGMGYGSKTLELLKDYYEGKFTDLSESSRRRSGKGRYSINRVNDEDISNKLTLQTEEIKLRDANKLPPLLLKLNEYEPYYLDYLGVSFGLTKSLHKFWKKSGYSPVYLRQTANELTGEHTCVMVNVLENREKKWLKLFCEDFHKRFLTLLSFNFRKFSAIQSLNIIESCEVESGDEKEKEKERRGIVFDKGEMDRYFSQFDLKRLESYSNNLIDYHVILDMIPEISRLYFNKVIDEEVKLSSVQSAILLSIGLQNKEIGEISKELGIENNQGLAIFSKIIRKVSVYFREVLKKSIEVELPKFEEEKKEERYIKEMDGIEEGEEGEEEEDKVEKLKRIGKEIEDDLEEEGNEVIKEMRERERELINSLELNKYEINEDIELDEKKAKKAISQDGSGIVSAKNTNVKRKKENADEIYEQEMKVNNRKMKKSRKNKKK